MNIEQLKTVLPFLKESGLVPNVIGKHGIGKSSVIAQFAKDNGYSFHPYFLGQMSDSGDILGLPEFNRNKEGKALSVSFVHPDKLPKKPKSILFFDELNRASKDLLQAIFQLALEGTLHDYELPKDSMIIMAMNPATDDYSVLDFADKAFADRFVHINLDPTHEEFHNYMRSRYGTSDISRFLETQTKLLEELDLAPVTLDFVKPSRRS
jgi:MoxR-like ATPase